MRTGRILSVGSVNIDHCLGVPAIPKPGETVLAESVSTCVGGKSFNQAAAARLLGGDVELVAMVGEDDAARTVNDELRELGIGSERILVSRDEPTGSAFISVDASGENSIVVVPGANAKMASCGEADAAVAEADVVLLACEIPVDAVAAFARRAAMTGAKVVVNLSPYRPVAEELFRDSFVVIVNDHELARLRADAMPPGTAEDDAETAAALRHMGIRRAIVTRGSRGSMLVDADGCTSIPAVQVNAADTTGCGDAFAGTVGYGLACGLDLAAAVRLGSEVGAFAATRPGARPSYPRMSQLEAWRKSGYAR